VAGFAWFESDVQEYFSSRFLLAGSVSLIAYLFWRKATYQIKNNQFSPIETTNNKKERWMSIALFLL